MKRLDELQKINTQSFSPLIVILRGVTPKNIIAVAIACYEQGYTTLEVTLNSFAALTSIALLKEHFAGKLNIGAGTVTTVEEVAAVKQAGGTFIVSPNCNLKVIEKTKSLGLLSYPGVLTPSEAFLAISHGADALKLFPAVLLKENGIKAFADVLPPHIPIFAVGGIAEQNFSSYINSNCLGFGIGSNLFSPSYSLQKVTNRAKKIATTYVTEIYKECTLQQLTKTVAELGEGSCWDKFNNNLHWIDIANKTLYTAQGLSGVFSEDKTIASKTKIEEVEFDAIISAMAVIDENRWLIASEHGLLLYNHKTKKNELICSVEDKNELTRSNDGRTDRRGCFWFGTMGKNAEVGIGAIYRFDGTTGTLIKVFDNITIPNSICFSPDGNKMYFADTAIKTIFFCELNSSGLPASDKKVFVKVADGSPDGSVVDAKGYVWNAQWGASRIVKYSPSGFVAKVIPLPASQPTCPVFIGENVTGLAVITAYEKLNSPSSYDGGLFLIDECVAGLCDEPFKYNN